MCTTWIKPIPGVCSYWFSVTKFMVHTWTNDCAWCIPMGAIGWVIHTTKVELWVERDYVYSYPHLEPVGCNAGSRDLGDSCTVPNQPPPSKCIHTRYDYEFNLMGCFWGGVTAGQQWLPHAGKHMPMRSGRSGRLLLQWILGCHWYVVYMVTHAW